MSYRIELSEFATEDLAEILEWYREQRQGLEQEFLSNFRETLTRIESNPFIFQIRYKQTRFAMVHKFPYKIIYRIFEDTVKVAGIIHHARNPRVIRKRLK